MADSKKSFLSNFAEEVRPGSRKVSNYGKFIRNISEWDTIEICVTGAKIQFRALVLKIWVSQEFPLEMLG